MNELNGIRGESGKAKFKPDRVHLLARRECSPFSSSSSSSYIHSTLLSFFHLLGSLNCCPWIIDLEFPIVLRLLTASLRN